MTNFARRRSEAVGVVNYPQCNAPNYESKVGFFDTKEGGSEIWLIVPPTRHDELSLRSIAITGFHIGIVAFDAVPDREIRMYLPDVIYDKGDWGKKGQRPPQPVIDGALCLASSGMSPWDCAREEYWKPEIGDLTDEGKAIFFALKKLYMVEPIIGFVLDT